mmetsp:Transcript_4439/g.6157  ORF Transcript_4439/g.6157 Transcript_4439/m.6157 type:complete len:116 (-) Transcript_4439:2-349(-)
MIVSGGGGMGGGGMGYGNNVVTSGGMVTGGSMVTGGNMMGGVSPVMSGPGGGGKVVVAGDGDPCGCGPGSSAGDCSGACGGMETMCCEAEGGVSNVQWVPVGSGGAYSPVMSYHW